MTNIDGKAITCINKHLVRTMLQHTCNYMRPCFNIPVMPLHQASSHICRGLIKSICFNDHLNLGKQPSIDVHKIYK